MSTGRKIVFFLGAGASVAAGARTEVQGRGSVPIPTQADFWSTLLRFCRSPKRRKQIESFLFRYFLGYHKVPSRAKPQKRRRRLDSINVEEVFTFLSERMTAPSTSSQLRAYATDVWKALVGEVGHVFSRFPANTQTRRVFRKLIKEHVRSRDAIVSFNYDTVFESSLLPAMKWAYEGIEDACQRLRVLKPHGSVNWERDNTTIKKVAQSSKPVVVAPTHLKFIQSHHNAGDHPGYLDGTPEIRNVWSQMEKHMWEAKALVFVGYSFPIADLYFSSVLRSVLATRKSSVGVILVNPDAMAIRTHLRDRFNIKRILPYFALDQFIGTNRKQILKQLDVCMSPPG